MKKLLMVYLIFLIIIVSQNLSHAFELVLPPEPPNDIHGQEIDLHTDGIMTILSPFDVSQSYHREIVSALSTEFTELKWNEFIKFVVICSRRNERQDVVEFEKSLNRSTNLAFLDPSDSITSGLHEQFREEFGTAMVVVAVFDRNAAGKGKMELVPNNIIIQSNILSYSFELEKAVSKIVFGYYKSVLNLAQIKENREGKREFADKASLWLKRLSSTPKDVLKEVIDDPNLFPRWIELFYIFLSVDDKAYAKKMLDNASTSNPAEREQLNQFKELLEVAKIEISFKARIVIGDRKWFLAKAYDSDGNELLKIRKLFKWKVTGGIGTIDEKGIFKAVKIGAGSITAFLSVRYEVEEIVIAKAEVPVKVLPVKINIKSPPDRLKMGEEYELKAEAYDQDGKEVDTAHVDWSWEESDNLEISENFIRGVRLGKGEVKLSLYGMESHLEVTVVPYEIKVEPEEVEVEEGDKLVFKARALDKTGKEIQDVPQFEWKVMGGIGVIDDEGEFSATKTGEGTVLASLFEGAVKGSSKVTVYILNRIDLLPDEIKLRVGEGREVQVKGYKQNEEVITVELNKLRWRIDPSELGRISQWKFKALEPGRGTLTASHKELKDISQILIHDVDQITKKPSGDLTTKIIASTLIIGSAANIGGAWFSDRDADETYQSAIESDIPRERLKYWGDTSELDSRRETLVINGIIMSSLAVPYLQDWFNLKPHLSKKVFGTSVFLISVVSGAGAFYSNNKANEKYDQLTSTSSIEDKMRLWGEVRKWDERARWSAINAGVTFAIGLTTVLWYDPTDGGLSHRERSALSLKLEDNRISVVLKRGL